MASLLCTIFILPLYINYDVREVKQYGKDMYERMLEIQTKLNLVNSTCTFEVD